MPRWRALPEELDPQVGEFTGRLRRLVERSGLSVAAVADRTGYSRTSWERFLNGRLLPPLRAVVKLAEVTGTDAAHLTTLWELAERAWSRSEMRHDVTMEAIRVAQARAALEGAEGAASGAGRGVRTAVAAPVPPGDGGGARRRRVPMILTGVLGALLVAVAAVLLVHPAGGEPRKAAPRPPATPVPKPVLPEGVKCSGAGCAGRDPEAMGCGGQHAVSPSRGMAGGALIEVRYSKVCRAAWARISGAAQGDRATVSAGDRSATARAERNGAGYTAMVEVTGDPARVAACGTTAGGVKGCARAAAN
ncbi:helix-turn-helix domain-containing protein [Streptomyces sp. NPDC053427]|uniref:helix-turn-helix domain-containing protein n=1 Tax=Streptomyces sp. NPDC053427 TaxID=3365701 RepID=UPI0037D72ECD